MPERCIETILTVTDDAAKTQVTVHLFEEDTKKGEQRFATEDGQPVRWLSKGHYLIVATAVPLRALYRDAP